MKDLPMIFSFKAISSWEIFYIKRIARENFMRKIFSWSSIENLYIRIFLTSQAWKGPQRPAPLSISYFQRSFLMLFHRMLPAGLSRGAAIFRRWEEIPGLSTAHQACIALNPHSGESVASLSPLSWRS